jgi:hypothetical protein
VKRFLLSAVGLVGMAVFSAQAQALTYVVD